MASQSKRPESEIRDQLKLNLDLIEPGLSLVGEIDKETMLPNDKGAKGFVDIFCRTANGKYLIIEVKRSDAAARSAVQELVKYIALLKQNLLVKESEVRLLIASSEWRELLSPFSEFVRSAPYDCKGLKLLLGKDGFVSSTEEIQLAPQENWRRLSRRHAIWGFKDETAALAAVRAISDYIHDAGLRDFVLVMMALKTPGEELHRFLYFAQQELPLETYMLLIRARFSQDEISEFEESIEDLLEVEDKVAEAADKVWEPRCEDESTFGLFKAIGQQISHPEKARAWFSPESLASSKIFRFGRFDDPNISDKMIIDDILGEDGASLHHGDFTAHLSSKVEVAALLSVADNLLHLNPLWRTAVHDLCTYAQKTGAVAIHLRAFSNEDILRSVAGFAVGYSGFAPALVVEIDRTHSVERVFGTLEWDGRRPEFDQIVPKYFEGDVFQYFMLCHFGGQKQINADLMAELGISYALCKIAEDEPIRVRVRPSSVDVVQNEDHKSLEAFLTINDVFIERLVCLFRDHDGNFHQIVDRMALSHFERRLEESARPNGLREPIYWADKTQSCDLCDREMSEARYLVDSAVTPGGPWGCMCAVCFANSGGSIGWGKGQLYERDDNGWRLVGGGPPIDEDDAGA